MTTYILLYQSVLLFNRREYWSEIDELIVYAYNVHMSCTNIVYSSFKYFKSDNCYISNRITYVL